MSGSSFIMTSGDDINPLWMADDDQGFATHARQAVPRLLAEVRRPRAQGTSCERGIPSCK